MASARASARFGIAAGNLAWQPCVDGDLIPEPPLQAIARGAFGSPFVIVDGEPFWGLDRFDQIERWLATGGF